MGNCSAGVSVRLGRKKTNIRKKNKKCENLFGATTALRDFLFGKKQNKTVVAYVLRKSGGGCVSVLHVLPVRRVHGRRVAVAPQHDGGGQDVQRGVKLQGNTTTHKTQTASF